MAFAKNKKDDAIRLMAEAVEMENNTTSHPVTPGEVLPTGELMGDLLMELGRPGDALEAYETDLAKHPNRFNGIYGAATAAAAISNHQKAAKYFKLLIDLTQNSNIERSELIQAREYLAKI
jgi:tetratricopeptide (TPR) repeat protein